MLGWIRWMGCAVAGALSMAVGAAGASADQRPNIVLIMADDLGYSDVGCYGGEIETPNLDSLAAGGLRFTQFYNTSRCCPTRAALLTGLYPHQAGIGHMGGNDGLPGYQGYLNDQCLTLAEALRPAGYTTLATGKWHVGAKPGHWPLDRGFDRYWGTPNGGGVYFRDALQIRREVFFLNGNERVELPEDAYVTDLFTSKAIEFIKESRSGEQRKPFFLYLPHIAPHWPLQAKPEDIAKYRGRYDNGWDDVRSKRFARQQELGIMPATAQLSPRDPQAAAWDEKSEEARRELAHRMEIYAAQVDCIDQNLGRLIATLKELGEFENTLILFLSDNGCSAEGGPGGFSRGIAGAEIGTGSSYASVGLEWANTAVTPFRKFKIDTYEGGVATPLIAHWPAGIAERGGLRHQPGHVIDIMPTLLEVAGATYPAKSPADSEQALLPLEGQSLVPAFANQQIDRGPIYWEHQGNKAIRIGNWKAVNPRNGTWELYDLNQDRTELKNLATEHPEKLRELIQAWRQWAQRCGVVSWQEIQRIRRERTQAGN